MILKQPIFLIALLSLFVLSGCTKDSAKAVKISWSANKEAAVNTTGGGYKVYYSGASGFSVGDAGVTVVDVPYVSGPTPPTTTTIFVSSGTYFIRVAGYSAVAGGTTSNLSPQVILSIPKPSQLPF